MLNRKLTFLVVLFASIIAPHAALTQEGKNSSPSGHANSSTVRRGAPLGDAESVAFKDMIEDPRRYAGKTILVEGVVERVCTNKGCWMEIASESGASGVRVTFKDYGFFVPKDSKGMRVRAAGEVVVKKLNKEQADHYEGEGARIRRESDGTADEVTFVAAGVELSRS